MKNAKKGLKKLNVPYFDTVLGGMRFDGWGKEQ